MLHRSRSTRLGDRSRDEREGQRGQILVLFSIVVVVLMALVALVIDVGLLRTDSARLQNALDAGSLAAAQQLPADINNFRAIADTARDYSTGTTHGNFAGTVGTRDPHVRFLCLVGVDPAGTGPKLSDIPAVCNVPVNSEWKCTAIVCFAPCGLLTAPYYPDSVAWRATDVCNSLEVRAASTRQYSFARVVGIDSGNTGALVSDACKGACGPLSYDPVDAVTVIDRTLSMDPEGEFFRGMTPVNIGNHADFTPQLREGARAVLSAFDPAVQHVALGLIGPSDDRRTGPANQCLTTSGAANGAYGKVLPYRTGPDPVPDPVAYQGDWSDENGGTNGDTSLSIRTAGTATDQVLIAAITIDANIASNAVTIQYNTSNNLTPPANNWQGDDANWHLINRVQQGSLTQLTYWKAVGTARNWYRWSWGTSGNQRAAGGVIAFSGADTGAPIGAASVNSGTTTNINRTLTANTVNGTNNSMLVGLFSIDASTTVTPSGGNQLTERFDVNRATSPTAEAGTRSQDAGASGNKTATVPNGVASGTAWAAQLIALKTPPPPPPPYVYDPASQPSYPTDPDRWIPVKLSGTTDADGRPAEINDNYFNPDTGAYSTGQLVKTIDCVLRPNTLTLGTDLTTPMRYASAYLQAKARVDPDSPTGKVKTGIIFETDGTPQGPNGSLDGDPPFSCLSAFNAAQAAKAAGAEVFTIVFLPTSNSDIEDTKCRDTSGTYRNQYALKLMADMSTPRTDGHAVFRPANAKRCSDLQPDESGADENNDGDHFFCVDTSHPADLKTAFQKAAIQLAGGPRLVQLYGRPDVDGVSPGGGSTGGGNTVTITGKNFDGAYSVTFGAGNPGSIVSVDADSTPNKIVVRAPAGAAGQVDIQVSTPGGTSKIESVDHYTFSP